MNVIDRNSILSVPLTLRAQNNERLGNATGFFWRGAAGRTYLVSNRHVFTGNHYQTNACLRNDSAFPMTIEYPRMVDVQHPHERTIHAARLCDEAGNSPSWQGHPIHNDVAVDVSFIEIPKAASDSTFVIAVNDQPEYECNKLLKRYPPGFELIVTGFFLKDRPTGYFPTYIRAFVASEMDALYHGKSAFLIDAQTSSGMSGSPVFATGLDVVDPTKKFGGGFKTTSPFVGIYSGRITEQENGRVRELQVGVVWRRELISEMIACHEATSI